MPRRIFKHISRQRQRWKDRWFLRPFRLLLEHPVYWALNRRNVTRAFALGLFIAFIPAPGHMALATILALLLRLNVPAAFAGCLITNPVTMVPLFYLAYRVGYRLLDETPRAFHFQLTWEWVTTSLLPIWKPFVLGCFVTGTAIALAGYFLLGAIWHMSLVLKYRQRKRHRDERSKGAASGSSLSN